MKHCLIPILLLLATAGYGQTGNIAGTYIDNRIHPELSVTFKTDSTFEYASWRHPNFFWDGNFTEKGRWQLSGDTIILNPQLTQKPFVETAFHEQTVQGDTALLLTFNHIRRYYDGDGMLVRMDTLQVRRLDYAFNTFRKKRRIRVTDHPTTRCAFAGYIPKEIITGSRAITVPRPAEGLKSIYIGCFESQGTKEYLINNPGATRLTLDVYSNYYQDGQIRQKKFLVKNVNTLLTYRKPNGKFQRDGLSMPSDAVIKRR